MVAVGLLAACSGGGGGGGGVSSSGAATTVPPVASTDTFPINTAIANLVVGGFQATVTISGNENGLSVSGMGTYAWNPAWTPFSGTTFENAPAIDVANAVNLTLVVNGASTNISSITDQYFSANYLALGQADAYKNTYYVVTSFTGWPLAAKVGDSGPLGSVTVYADSTKATVTGHQQLSYTIEPDTADTAIFNLTTVESDTTGAVVLNQQDRYRVTTTGAVTFISSGGVVTDSTGTTNLLLTATSIQSPPPPALPTPLPMHYQAVAYQIDPAHSGQVAYGQPLNFPLTPTWSVNLGNVVSYPLIVDGKVFVTTAGPANVTYGIPQLYALNEATGNIVWGPVATSGINSSNDYFAGHAYDNGKVFVINYDGLLQSFDATTGTVVWSTQLAPQALLRQFTAPPTAVNGIVYVGGYSDPGYGTLYAVGETNGAVLWTAGVMYGDNSSPAVTNEGVFVTYPYQIYKFDPITGAPLWHFAPTLNGGGGGKTPVYADGKLYVRNFLGFDVPRGQIYDTTSGMQIGSFDPGQLVNGLYSDSSGPIPAISSNTGFFQYIGTLQAIDLTSNNMLWSFVGDGNLVSSPIVIDQTVIVGSSSGTVYALNAANGAQLWSGNAGAAIAAPGLSIPPAGLGAGEGYLVVPAGNVLTAWKY